MLFTLVNCGINTKLLISPRIFIKIWRGPNGILRGPWEMIHKKTWSRKSRVRLPWNWKKGFLPIIYQVVYTYGNRRKVGPCIFRLLPGLVPQSCVRGIFCNSVFTRKLLRILRLVYTLSSSLEGIVPRGPRPLLQTLSCPPNNSDASATRGAIRQFTPSHQCHAFSWCSVSLISIPSLVFFQRLILILVFSIQLQPPASRLRVKY